MPLIVTLPMAVGCALPEVRRHVHALDAFEVPDRAVHHQATALRGLHDVVEQVVADDRAVLRLAEQIHHQHVAGLEHVDRRLVVQAGQPGRLRFRGGHAVEVGAQRHELHRERTADQSLPGMQHPEAVGVLVAKALPREDGEDLFGGQAARPLEERVRDLGPAVGEPLERILRGVLDQLLLRQGEQLGVGKDRRQHGRGQNADCQYSWFHRCSPFKTDMVRLTSLR